ncbi:MAG: beta-glucosidase [Symbiobacteriaceae bacterium]|nr:beta-glucosidase [Symbiobacteriaceae bacterium]
MQFPRDFLWGVATSSYQIEGAARADGRGESIWDRFSHTPGLVENGDTGDVACDHYNRYRDDIDLMASLGVQAYRFSVAWPRILPEGTGAVNAKGLDFYKRLVDGLLAKGIKPAITLYHWDLPQALQDRGGWANRDTAFRFAEYADHLYRALGDQVPIWMTINEPWVAGFLGHWWGVHAPGLKDLRTSLAAIHHMFLGHGLAVRQFRQLGLPGQVGIAPNLFPTYPETDSPADQAAARLSDGFTNRWFLDPVLRGSYPQDMVDLYTDRVGALDFIHDDDLPLIASPIDFLGVNFYERRIIGAEPLHDLGWKVVHPPVSNGIPRTDLGWEIVPWCLTDLLKRLKADYGDVPIYITENGAHFTDGPGADGQVHDVRRVAFLQGHFAAAHRAIAAGVNLKGYFCWSFMDNFEWAMGYSKRFGLIYVDYPTQRRIPKDSAFFLRDVIRYGLNL